VTNRLDGFKDETQEAMNDALALRYAARAREVQASAIEVLEAVKDKASKLKAEAIRAQEEDIANQLLSYESMLRALICELKMWIAFKDGAPHDAWSYLVRAQNAALSALRAHQEVSGSMEPYLDRLDLLEHVLFPPQVFVSPGFIIKSSKCSICESEYGECNHIKGRPYMGVMCSRIITEYIAQEISIVPAPANKHARMLIISDGEVTRDAMTLQILPEPGPEEDRSEWLRKHVLRETEL
jgi:hypothetical protein